MKNKDINNKDSADSKKKQRSEITSAEYKALSPEEQKMWQGVKTKYEKVPLWVKISLAVASLSIMLYIFICIFPDFADFFNIYISGNLRFILAQVTNILPFSLAETAIILIPLILFLSIRYIWKYRCNTSKSTLVSIVCIFSIASMFLSSFILVFSAGYRGRELDEKLGLYAGPVSKQNLYDCADLLVGEINALVPEIYYNTSDDFSKMPYSFNEMNDKLIEAYEKFSEKHSFINNFYSRLKPVLLSEAMSYAHITGVYTFFTGESNLNIGFPDYTVPYTAAHELAHQRGIAREDEANMIAFLVCMESDDAYIRYCAYLNMYEYVANALYKADKNLFREVDSKLNKSVYDEQVAYSKFFDKYERSVTSQVSGAVNDVYLQSQGTQGRVSYGMVVDLTVAYFKTEKLIPN